MIFPLQKICNIQFKVIYNVIRSHALYEIIYAMHNMFVSLNLQYLMTVSLIHSLNFGGFKNQQNESQ